MSLGLYSINLVNFFAYALSDERREEEEAGVFLNLQLPSMHKHTYNERHKRPHKFVIQFEKLLSSFIAHFFISSNILYMGYKKH